MAINESQLALLKIQSKRATTAEWNRTSDTGAAWEGYLLREAELGIEVFDDDTTKLKIGNGIDVWKDLPYLGADIGKFVTSLPPVSSALIDTFYILGDKVFYTTDNSTWVEIGGSGVDDFNKLKNRPKYNGSNITGSTNIPKVPTTASELSYSNTTSKLASKNVQSAIDETLTKLTNKLDKVALPNILYGNNSSASVTTYPFSTDTVKDTIAKRTSTGTLKGSTPVELDDLTTKSYVDTNINTVENEINTINTTVDGLQTKTSTLETRINTAETNINNNTLDIATLKNAINTNTTDISNLTTKVNTNTTDISTVKSDITNITTKLNTLDVSITDFQSDLDQEIAKRENQNITSIKAGQGSDQTQIILTKQDGTSLSANIPLVSSTKNGLMTPTAFNQITQNRNEIDALKQIGGHYIGRSFDTYADLQSYTVPTSIKTGDFTFIIDDETHDEATTRYIYDGNTFNFAYVIENDPISIATGTTAGIVLSSEEDGQINVDANGVMRLNGYNDLISKYDNYVLKEDGKGLSTNDYTTEEKDKVSLIDITGTGTKLLGDDGTYHEINLPEAKIQDVQVDGTSIVDGLGIVTLKNIVTTSSYNDLVDVPVDLVKDANYIHTDNNYTSSEKSIVSLIKTDGDGSKVLNDLGSYTLLSAVATTGSYNNLSDIPANLVQDADYVHTDKNFTEEIYNYIYNIPISGEANKIEVIKVNNIEQTITDKTVNIDLTDYELKTDLDTDIETYLTAQNVVKDADYTHTDNNFTTTLKTKLEGIEENAEVNKIDIVKVNDVALAIDSTDKSVNIPLSGFVGTDEFDELKEIVTNNTTEIQSLVAGGIWRGIFDTYADLPTTTPNDLFIGGKVDLNDYIIIKEDETHLDSMGKPYKTRYYVTAIDIDTGAITWTFFDEEKGSIAIATNTSLGLVKGVTYDTSDDTTVGKVSIDSTTGEMTVNGLTDLYIPYTGTTLEKRITGYLTFANNTGGVESIMGTDDRWAIIGRETTDSTGYMEIAAGGSGEESIYVRQYVSTDDTTEGAVSDVFSSDKKFLLKRTLTLLNSKGNLLAPNIIRAANELRVGDSSYTYKGAILPSNDGFTAWSLGEGNTNKNVAIHDSDGSFSVSRGIIGLYNIAKSTATKNGAQNYAAVIQWNADESCLEFNFNEA